MKLVSLGIGMTVKFAALVAVPAGVVTAILPLVAPLGTVAVICVALFTVKAALTPLKVTLLAPLKPLPVRVTLLATAPEVGTKPLTVGTLDSWLLTGKLSKACIGGTSSCPS